MAHPSHLGPGPAAFSVPGVLLAGPEHGGCQAWHLACQLSQTGQALSWACDVCNPPGGEDALAKVENRRRVSPWTSREALIHWNMEGGEGEGCFSVRKRL